MLRSLHVKLVVILMLLILSIMAVVGAFLINSVALYHIGEFSDQMYRAFSEQPELVTALREAAGEPGAPAALRERLSAYSGLLGIDRHYRNYFVLDGYTGAYLTGSDEELGASLELTPNIKLALTGEVGSARSITDSILDVAIPVSNGDNRFIVYVMDNKTQIQSLTGELVSIILQSLLFGIAIAIVLSFLLSKTMTTPIEQLTKGTKQLAEGKYTGRLEVRSKDEIGTLTVAFNDMAKVLHDTLAAVEEERDKLETLFLHMTDGVAAFSRDGTLIHINPAAKRLLAVKRAESETYASLFGGLLPLEGALALRPPEFLELTENRGKRILKLFFAPFGGDEGEGGIITVVHDVTEQTRQENVRREFVANVSHELRTPLTNVKSYSETLLENPGLGRETEEQFLAVILNETDRMTRIVSDLLTLSRFDYGKTAMQLERTSITRVVERVYEAMALEAKNFSHNMTLELPGLLPDVVCDRDRIEQVLVNIVSNAIKYTPEGGTIDISAEERGAEIVITVSDSGIGVPASEQERLFERFFRVDKARSRERGGSGLGLSIAKEIVDRHGGTISLVSEENKGTTVRVSLPVDGPPAQE